MSGNVFIPKLKKEEETEPAVHASVVTEKDDIGSLLHRMSQYIIIALFGLLPVFFTPGLWASLGFDKSVLALVAVGIVMILGGLLALRKSQVATIMPLTLALFWVAVVIAYVSGSLSGDAQDSLRGSTFEIHTASFTALLGIVMTIPLLFQGSKLMTIKALTFFTCTGALLLTYNVLRVIFGADFLSFDTFNAVTVSPLGGFNDLAIFAGMMVILGLVTLIQLPLKAVLQYAIAGLVMVALVLLSIVNFFNIWIAVGFFALLVLLYLLSRDKLFKGPSASASSNPRVLIGVTTLVCLVSIVFIVAGDYAGKRMSDLTSVDFVEVRPSLEATMNIAQAVYNGNALLGIGPNRFADAWRQYKDPSINETIFWETDFSAGNGYVPTLFVTTGLLGGVLVLVFHLGFLYLGYRMLLRSTQRDSYWYYFGSLNFAAATFIWGMSYVYVPGAGILLLGALFTGFTFVAAAALLPYTVRTVPLAINRQRGFFIMAAVIVIITTTVGTLFTFGKQYVAQASFSETRSTNASIDVVEQAALRSYGLYPDDRFVSARAQIYLADLATLLGVSNPSEAEQERFLRSAEQALIFSEKAVQEDITNPDHHAVLASVYINLAVAGVDGALERAKSALAEAKRLDPLNPGYHLIEAQMAARIGDMTEARAAIDAALQLKRNYTQALYLSAQLDIAEGNADSAIETTRAIITLEPTNPTRYFQLGVLLTANNDLPQAIAAYRAAIALDPQYANARYLLALAYLGSDEQDKALEQLIVVRQTNPDNAELLNLIAQVESGQYEVPTNTGLETPVNEIAPGEDFEETITTEAATETDLVTPVNTISELIETEDLVTDDTPEQDVIDESALEIGEGETATETAPTE
ncbi:tetratricopeptide repeat protein [Candidatus Nomurabacteria bacterium]|nr:tetratricopeptide repeat protein [Candidatus Nomurabacteria bacterium]